jgi:hypothetical protein
MSTNILNLHYKSENLDNSDLALREAKWNIFFAPRSYLVPIHSVKSKTSPPPYTCTKYKDHEPPVILGGRELKGPPKNVLWTNTLVFHEDNRAYNIKETVKNERWYSVFLQ